jgi:3',5'-cyclic AMP phosphodiesterase CpdA
LVDDPDGPGLFFSIIDRPGWLTADSDSLYGIPRYGLRDTNFTVIASDGFLADTLEVALDMIPTLVVYGDTRSGHEYHAQIVNLIRQTKPSTVFHTGDLVNSGNIQADWDMFNQITAEMRSESEFFPALGNHEYQSPLYFDNFELPNNEQWYTVERNRTHFIILNSCVDLSVGSEQYLWLESDLASVSDTLDFIVAIFHHPPYSTGPHTEDEMGLRETIVPLLEQYGVDIVFNGHDHCYERSYCGGRYYIVAGGGGAPLYDQDREHPCSQLFLKKYHFCVLSIVDHRAIVKVFDIEAVLIDQFEIEVE